MTHWSPELEMVARLARVHPSPADESRVRELSARSLDWSHALQLAVHHGVVPLVEQNLSRLDVAALYAALLEACITRQVVTLEEPIFSALHAHFPAWFTLHRFDTWWFYAPGERCSYLASRGTSFYKIFTAMLPAGPGEPASHDGR